jgi:hypothetical protein
MSFIVNEPSLEKDRRMRMLNYNDYTTTRDFIYTSPYEIYAGPTYAGPTYAGPTYAEPITVTPSKNSFPLNAEPSKCYNFCPCYKKDSADSRCCGFCYYFYPPKKSNNIHCEICPNGFFDHCRSGYIYTDDAGCKNEDDDNTAGCYCIICFPFKLAIFSPCLLGSLFNSCVNSICKTNTNYLF